MDAGAIRPAMADGLNSQDLQIQLDTAQTDLHYAVRGKYIAVDAASTGQASLKLNSPANLSRLVYPGTVLTQPFTDLFFTFPAQPGKVLHVIYGDSPDILAAGQKVSIDAAINVTTSEGRAVVSGTRIILVPRAQNVNGIKILGGSIAAAVGVGGAGVSIIFLAYNNLADTDSYPLAIVGLNGTEIQDSKTIAPFIIPPGRDLYINTVVTGFGSPGSWTLNYEVL